MLLTHWLCFQSSTFSKWQGRECSLQ